ncbi:MAG: phosphoglucosamine mutase [Bacteroidales bacterium]|nr:phosphoglucosamine mutase [Bacteroidales bacterium]HQH15290.1 phosphoglucosamine mutase [Bacteroidales bacterium]
MSLIKSISGIRGIIGGRPGENLTPVDVVKFTAAYAMFLKKNIKNSKLKVVVGRDARVSGDMLNSLVTSTLNAMGIDVIDAGLSTTPTVEIAVVESGANGGIILTASHNPGQWNALKLLDEHGEFLSQMAGEEILVIAENEQFHFSPYNELGKTVFEHGFIDLHIQKIISLPMVDAAAIRNAGFVVAVDAVNSTGGLAVPKLLEELGVERIEKLYCEPTGLFPHNPEPLPENLTELAKFVVKKRCNIGFAVDPDVDRLAIINEDGTAFGEEYTLVAVADYILRTKPGNTVSNLSSTRALMEVTHKAGGNYMASAVGEVNVVKMMKETNAVIGGEGNGGVIYPEIHYGRDALVGIALFLTFMAKTGKKPSQIRQFYPNYFISKNKITLEPDMNVDQILERMALKYSKYKVNRIDGVRIDFENDWVHLRKSNTEPIVRIYTESNSEAKANHLAQKMITDIGEIVNSPEVED